MSRSEHVFWPTAQLVATYRRQLIARGGDAIFPAKLRYSPDGLYWSVNFGEPIGALPFRTIEDAREYARLLGGKVSL